MLVAVGCTRPGDVMFVGGCTHACDVMFVGGCACDVMFVVGGCTHAGDVMFVGGCTRACDVMFVGGCACDVMFVVAGCCCGFKQAGGWSGFSVVAAGESEIGSKNGFMEGTSNAFVGVEKGNIKDGS